MKGREIAAWHYTSDRDFRRKGMGTKSPRKFTILVPFLLNSPRLGGFLATGQFAVSGGPSSGRRSEGKKRLAVIIWIQRP
jgi:hypothetical protein